MMISVLIIAITITIFMELERRRQRTLRDTEIQRALIHASLPPAWWPPEWRQELASSVTIEGEVTLAGKKVGAGTVLFLLEPEKRVFAARISAGRYSMKHDRMPTGSYWIELRSEDHAAPRTSRSPWKMPIDQGFHKMNLAF